MKTWLVILLAAFLVQLTDGRQILVREAVGFVMGEIKSVRHLGFFDANMAPLVAIPVDQIKGAVYVSDDRVM